MATYDFVIAGGGLAGLSLACQMVRSPLAGASILVVDRNPTPLRDRLWSYWTDRPTLFDSIVAHNWPQLHVAGEAYSTTCALPGRRYALLRGADLDLFARQELGRHAQVDFRQGRVDDIIDELNYARVWVDGEQYRARWVFDSTGWPGRLAVRRPPWAMYFKGWTVETSRPSFNPEAVTFVDTRTPQQADLRFFYVLPFSERRALVEYVVYSSTPSPLAVAPAALNAYLQRAWGLPAFNVAAEETGCLPIVAAHHPRRLGRHHLAIGARAGLIKPSTGFALCAIEQDAAAIVESLVRHGHPWHCRSVSPRHRLYDALLLDVLAHQGQAVAGIFGSLFARNPLGRVLRFLDETSTLSDDLHVIATMPANTFLPALPRWAATEAAYWLAPRSTG